MHAGIKSSSNVMLQMATSVIHFNIAILGQMDGLR